MKIWKYEVSLVGLAYLKLPKECEFLQLGVQKGCPYMWFLVNPDNVIEDRTFLTVNTGEPIEVCLGVHMGSFQTSLGYVGHVFEV